MSNPFSFAPPQPAAPTYNLTTLEGKKAQLAALEAQLLQQQKNPSTFNFGAQAQIPKLQARIAQLKLNIKAQEPAMEEEGGRRNRRISRSSRKARRSNKRRTMNRRR